MLRPLLYRLFSINKLKHSSTARPQTNASKFQFQDITGFCGGQCESQQSVKYRYTEIVHIKSLFWGSEYCVGFEVLQTQGGQFNE
jgi:hypothetical protein